MRVRSVKFEDELDEFRPPLSSRGSTGAANASTDDGEESSGEANMSLQEGMSKLQLVPEPGVNESLMASYTKRCSVGRRR